MSLTAVVGKEGKFYVAKTVELEVASQGKTIEEALANLREAVGLYLKHADESELAALRKKSAPYVLTPLDVPL